MSAIKQPLKIYQLKIILNHIKPEIWRRFQVRSDVKLTRLHDIIQIVMGWEDCHLYAFDVGSSKYAHPDSIEDDEYDLGYQDASRVRLADALPHVGDKCRYRYDFGDDWEHTIELEKTFDPEPGDRYPVCIDGARRCPPEDCGGAGGYEELLRVLADPEDEEYEETRLWIGPYFDAEKFDPRIANIKLPRRVVVKQAEDAGARNVRRDDPESNNKPGTYVSDMTHFLDENGLAPIGLAKEFYDNLNYHAAIVKAGSSHLCNAQFCSTVLCRTTLKRKLCGGHLIISHRPDGVIHWQCLKCGEQGFISNWRGTMYDLSGAVESDPTLRVSVFITADEHTLLSEIITSSQEQDAIICGAISTPDGVLMFGRVEDFDLLMGSITFDANHAKTVKHQRAVDRVYGRIEEVLEG